MAKRNYGLRRDADFTEDVVGYALESFLTLFSFPRRRFSIEPFSRAEERRIGADARLDSDIRGFTPFYMQFKRPSAYPDYSTSKIVKDRRRLGLSVAPHSLYFELRQKRPHHSDFQHNLLLRLREDLRRDGRGDAAYICPLFLDRSAYRWHIHWSGLAAWMRFWHWRPWDIEDVLLHDGDRTIRFDRMRILAEHITIPPHAPVSTARHRYSFNESGDEVCFHSPKSLPEGSMSLATFLSKVAAGFLDGGDKILREQAGDRLRDLIAAVEPERLDQFGSGISYDDDPIGNWLAWGDHLKSNYGIDQYALVKWAE